jgi:hypothetical protein
MVLIKAAQAIPEIGGVATGSKFKPENFGEGLCIRWRRLDRGMPGGVSELRGLRMSRADLRTSHRTLRPF